MAKHTAMTMKQDIRINCPIGKLIDDRICDTITQKCDTITQKCGTISQSSDTITQTIKMSDAIYRAGNYVVFKSEIPHTVDVFEILPEKKLRPVASFMRDADKYALGAAKNFLLTKV